VFRMVMGTDTVVGERMVADRRLPLISATGSCRMGRRVGQVVAERIGRCLLELGGNNAVILHKDADLDLALRAVLFAAVGTAGPDPAAAQRRGDRPRAGQMDPRAAEEIRGMGALLGDWTHAMDWVERAYAARPTRLRRTLTELPFDRRGFAVDPRYTRLLRVAVLEDLL